MKRAPILWAICFALVISIPATGLTGDAEVSDVVIKWEKEPGEASAFRAKIRVTNPTDRDLKVFGFLRFYDAEGFEISRVPFSGEVKARGGAILPARGFLLARDREEIARYEATIEGEYPLRW